MPLVQLYQPELLSTGHAAKVRSGKGFAGAADPAGTVSPQGPVWIGKGFRFPINRCHQRVVTLSPLIWD